VITLRHGIRFRIGGERGLMGPMQKFLRPAHGQDDDLDHRPDYWFRVRNNRFVSGE
jgi:hypothetical protein